MIELAIAAIAILCASLLIQERFKVSLPVSLMGFSLAASQLGLFSSFMDYVTFSAILTALLPLLIAGDASGIKWADFKRHWFRFFYLACVSLILSVGSAVLIHHFILPDYSFSYLDLALLYIPAVATDPVAVGSVMGGRKDIPHEVKVTAEAESLLNDLVAMICYGVCVSFLSVSGSHATSEMLVQLATTIIAPLVLGGVIGFVCIGLLKLTRDPLLEFLLIVLSAYAAFYGAEHYFHASGILAVVVDVVLTVHYILKFMDTEQEQITDAMDTSGKYHGKISTIVSRENHKAVLANLKSFGLLAVAAIFLAMAATLDWDALRDNWKPILAVFLSTTLIRFVMMSKAVGLSNLSSRVENMKASWIPVLGFAGVRGGLSLAMMSIFLPDSYEHKIQFEVIMSGVIVISTLVLPLMLSLTIKLIGKKL